MLKLFTTILVFAMVFTGKASGENTKAQNLPVFDDKILRFGFNIGFNTMDFGITPTSYSTHDSIVLNPDLYRLSPGFHVSAVSNLRLGEYFDFRFMPGISFGQRKLDFINIRNPNSSVEFSPQKINSSYLDFPMHLKYKALRINNIRPYFVGGFNFRIDMAAKKDYNEEKGQYLRLKRASYYYELGIGFESYLAYFKLTTEIKVSVGITDNLVHDTNSRHPEFVNAIDRLTSRLVCLSFYFE
jgi:hypothetical protein